MYRQWCWHSSSFRMLACDLFTKFKTWVHSIIILNSCFYILDASNLSSFMKISVFFLLYDVLYFLRQIWHPLWQTGIQNMLRSGAGHNYLFWISGLWLMPSCYNCFISSNWTAWILVHRWQASWRQTWIFWCTIFVEIWTCRFTSQWYSSSTFMPTLLLSTISDFAALALV
jgi:hypothetical protein